MHTMSISKRESSSDAEIPLHIIKGCDNRFGAATEH